jgi:hypothetical protein
VDLQHLGDARQRVDHDRVLTLGDLEGREGEDRVAERGQVDVGPEAGEDTGRLQAVEARLDRPPGHAQAAGELQHTRPGDVRERREEASIQRIHAVHLAP